MDSQKQVKALSERGGRQPTPAEINERPEVGFCLAVCWAFVQKKSLFYRVDDGL